LFAAEAVALQRAYAGPRKVAHVGIIGAVGPATATVLVVVRVIAGEVTARIRPIDPRLVDRGRPAEELVDPAVVAARMARVRAAVPAPLRLAVEARQSGIAIPVGIRRVAFRTTGKYGRYGRHDTSPSVRAPARVVTDQLAATEAVSRRGTRLARD
jgi:hypothetical protein